MLKCPSDDTGLGVYDDESELQVHHPHIAEQVFNGQRIVVNSITYISLIDSITYILMDMLQ